MIRIEAKSQEWLMEREPRYRTMVISLRDLACLTFGHVRKVDYLEVREVSSIPDDAEVCHIYERAGGMSLGIVIWHPSFDLVPEYCEPPCVVATSHMVRLKRLEPEKDEAYESYDADHPEIVNLP